MTQLKLIAFVSMMTLGCGNVSSTRDAATTTDDASPMDAAGPIECPVDTTLSGGDCINSKQVSCSASSLPANTQALVEQVEITYTDAAGWSEPSPCDYECLPAFCREAGGVSCSPLYRQSEGVEPSGASSFNTFGNRDMWLTGSGGTFVAQQTAVVGAISAALHETFSPSPSFGCTLFGHLRAEDGTILGGGAAAVPEQIPAGGTWLQIPLEQLDAQIVAGLTYHVTFVLNENFGDDHCNVGMQVAEADNNLIGNVTGAGVHTELLNWSLWQTNTGGTPLRVHYDPRPMCEP